jgi:hypothetical protein
MKNVLTITIALCVSIVAGAQATPTDTVVVELATSSKVVFTMKERSDLEVLKQYDFQALFADILSKLEKTDTAKVAAVDTTKKEDVVHSEVVVESWGDDDDDDDEWKERRYRHRTRHTMNFDFGTNNYLEEGDFPDANGSQYAIRPWGSWYIGVNSVLRTQVSNKFFIEWGAGVSWYNFKFQDDNTVMTQDSTGVSFGADPRDLSYKKSRLMVCYLNASIVPMFDFGGYNRKARFWGSNNSNFRIGVGPYVGYRIDSSHKLVYKEDGDKEKDKEKDDFYINNLRYGIRMQIGVRSADFFFNYDLNELFVENKGPKLNAFSFGVIF